MGTDQVAAVAAQLADELTAAVGPLAMIAGVDTAVDWPARIEQVAPRLAMELCQDDDARLAAQCCIDIMCALWPHGAPEGVGRADWWRTPLGLACARTLVPSTDDEALSYARAAEILGVHRGTVAQLANRGTLDRHPDGGVTRASVLRRAGR